MTDLPLSTTHIVKRGRKKKNDVDFDAFLQSPNVISFLPSRLTREQLVYCMRETGVFNKSAMIALAVKNFHDMLQAEAQRRYLDPTNTINPDNFIPKL